MTQERDLQSSSSEFSNLLAWNNHAPRDAHIVERTNYIDAVPIELDTDYYSNGYLVRNSTEFYKESYRKTGQAPIRTIKPGNPNDTTLDVENLPFGSLIAIGLEELWDTGLKNSGVLMLSVEKDPKTQNDRYLHMVADFQHHFGYPAVPLTVGEVRHVKICTALPRWKLERINQIELLTWGRPKLPEKPTDLKRGAIHRLFRR